MSKLTTSWSIACTDGTYTITFASTYDPISFPALSAYFLAHSNANYVNIGPQGGLTTLNWTLCTSPTAGDRTSFLTALVALDAGYVTIDTDQTVTGAKTFSQFIKLTPSTSKVFQVNTAGGGSVVYNTNSAFNSAATVTLPTSGTVSTVEATETITGAKTFNGDVEFHGGFSTDYMNVGSAIYNWQADDNVMILRTTAGGTINWISSNAATGIQNLTFPSVSATLATTDTAQTFTARKTFNSSPFLANVALLIGQDATTDRCALTANATGSAYTVQLPSVSCTLATNDTTETISGTKTLSAITTFSNATASTTSSTGAVVVTGGVGIGGALNTGGAVKINANTSSTSTTTGSLIVTGGVGISQKLYLGTGLFLPTTGGASASQLDYYEEFSSTISLTGPWTAQNVGYRIIRNGKICVLWFSGFAVAANSTSAKISGTLPSRFAPAVNQNMNLNVFDNGSIVLGTIEVTQTSGVINVGVGACDPTAASAKFNQALGTATAGIRSCAVTYHLI
jgi:hypothetical protein